MLIRIGLVVTFFSILTPVFANQCPSPDKVSRCSGSECTTQHVSGWSENVYYTDQKPLTLLRSKIERTSHGTLLSCYYAYIDPQSRGRMPPALVLRAMTH
jgi:hypothetical protein